MLKQNKKNKKKFDSILIIFLKNILFSRDGEFHVKIFNCMVVYGFPIQDAADFLQTKKST